MSRRLPPLNALRAFDAAARRLSFADAADELCVTPGAISRQIKALEDHFGMPLFEREHRRVTLRPEAYPYAQLVKEIFERLQVGSQRLAAHGKARPLHIVCPITFATRWLIPRIAKFTDVAPDQQIRLTTAISLIRNLGTITDADISIEYRKDQIPGFESLPLVQTRLVPVCSPAVARTLHNYEDLADVMLLHSATRQSAWSKWAAVAEFSKLETSRGMEFSSLALAYHAAIEGVGVAIGDLSLVANELSSGVLVAPFGPLVQTDFGYTLMYPRELADDPRVLTFRDWIMQQAEEEGQRGFASTFAIDPVIAVAA